jgi:hypothetical protein
MSIHPIALENTVAAVEFPDLSTVGYLLEWTDPNTRVTRTGNARVTRAGNTRVTRGYNSTTVYPPVNVVELPSVVSPVEIE